METLNQASTEEKKAFLNEIRQFREEIEDVLKIKGVEYKLDEWLTIAKYCEKFDISSTSIVSNWIKRGTIPAENVREIEELNGLKLIKAVPYR